MQSYQGKSVNDWVFTRVWRNYWKFLVQTAKDTQYWCCDGIRDSCVIIEYWWRLMGGKVRKYIYYSIHE